jgi:hypothetical protein
MRRSLAIGLLAMGVGAALVVLWTRIGPSLFPTPHYTLPQVGSDQASDMGAVEPLPERIASDTAIVRYLSALQVLKEIPESPILGHGTLAYGLTHGVFAAPGLTLQRGWIMSGLLLVLYDTGVVGVLAFLGFLGLLVTDAWRGSAKGDAHTRMLAVGAVAATAAWLIMDQITTSLILASTWCGLGLASGISRVALARAQGEKDLEGESP